MSRSVICAVGDLGPDRPDPRELFALVSPVLRDADVTFGQLELPISTRGERVPHIRHTSRSPLSTAPALREAGFDVLSMASNHVLDWGPEAMFDTMTALEDVGIRPLGVGANLAAAREPVVVETDGGTVGFLAYNSILPAGFWADERSAGCAPLRAFTHYEQIEPDQPGTPPRIRTFPHPEDLAGMVEDVTRLRERADVVIVSAHWGIHFVPVELAEYQRTIAHAAIDAGADLILGHHPHILKGVEVYRDVPILYSLCNFAIDLPMTQEHIDSVSFAELKQLNPEWEVSVDWRYNFPDDSAKTLVVRATVERGRITRTALLPTWIDRSAVPEVLAAQDPRFREVVDYLQRISDEAGLNAELTVEDDEVVVTARP